MAKLSADGTYVTVEKGDTLSKIASQYGNGATYKQLAALNGISNPNRISVGQQIKLTKNATGGSTTTTATTTVNSNVATITQFGLQSDTDNTLFATWSWNKSHTESYAILWLYDTGDGVWFVGSDSSISVNENEPAVSRQSTYTIPENANQVKFKVKPISKKESKNNKETSYWTAEWSTEKIYTVSDLPPVTPPTPSVEVEGLKLTARLNNLDVNATSIHFKVVKDETVVYKQSDTTIKTETSSAAYSCYLEAGGSYKVCCRSARGSLYSDWSEYTDAYETPPAASAGITVCKANSETSVYLEWEASETAKTYEIEYATKQEYFDGSDQTTTKPGIEFTHYELGGLETGTEYFFRVRAVNDNGESAWSSIKSVAVGTDPAAPTTWSSTTTAIIGESLTLFWIHNSEDGSSQTYAELELDINGVVETHTIKNTDDEEEKDKTSSYAVDISNYVEGAVIKWRVRTAGVTLTYGDWSVERTVDIYAPPTLDLSIETSDGLAITELTSFPFVVEALAGPNTQEPIGYHLTISSNDIYETVDSVGNVKTVNVGEAVYSKYFDITSALTVEFSANNINLENNVKYTITCVATMNSGLTAEESITFTVSWEDVEYIPNAEIGIDETSYTASIRPYCENKKIVYREVSLSGEEYAVTDTVLDYVYGETVVGTTTTGELVYSGTTADSDSTIYYCEVEETTNVEGVLLSVYRREFDGAFTEIASGLDNVSNIFVTDPHPALDYARYRIVATDEATGAISYYDVPGYPVGGKSVIIQWDEAWSTFDSPNGEVLAEPSWSGSLLKLPYNIDVSDSYGMDVSLVEYIGRKRPVSYYGTQLGESSTWNVSIEKDDKETLYALRHLAIWTGDVYVREPSGSGYWANISVSFSQKHVDLTIPVTLNITRVEGGI